MAKWLRRRRRLAVDLSWPLRVVVGGAFATIVVLTIAQVFFRFVLDSPLVWSEELVRILVVWITFLGAAVVCWDGTHLNVDVLFVRLPLKARRRLRVFNAVLAIGFLALLAWFSLPLIEIGWYVEIGALDLPDSVYRSPALVGHIHGGLAQVNIFASMIFAGMSGSATADTAALGSV